MMIVKKKKAVENVSLGKEAIYDARQLGMGKMMVLGLQHLFAMFGSTILVPTLTGLSVSATLLFAGIGTLLFHLLAKGKVPIFLGSSFAFLAGYFAIAPNGERELLPYACFGALFAGLLYLVLAILFKAFGVKKIMKYFPPVVTGPIIICIGLNLASSAINSCNANWGVALVAIVAIILCNIYGKHMIKIIPILIGVVSSYVVAACFGLIDFTPVKEAAWIGLPVMWQDTVFGLFGSGNVDKALLLTAVITMAPLSLATMVEHIGDMCAVSSTCGKNYLEDPGLFRTLLGDGLATFLASLFGAPANTSYGENTGTLELSKVYDPCVIRLAAIYAIFLSFCPKFSALIAVMPTATIGGVSLVLYGMISAVGVRNIVENKVDFKNSRNVIIAALIMVLALGVSNSEAGAVVIGTVSMSGIAVASIVGILLNAILKGGDYEFNHEDVGATSVNFKV